MRVAAPIAIATLFIASGACGAFGAEEPAVTGDADASPATEAGRSKDAGSSREAGTTSGSSDAGSSFCAHTDPALFCDDFEDLAKFGAKWNTPPALGPEPDAKVALDEAAKEGAGCLLASLHRETSVTVARAELVEFFNGPFQKVIVELDARTNTNAPVSFGVVNWDKPLSFGLGNGYAYVAGTSIDESQGTPMMLESDIWVHYKFTAMTVDKDHVSMALEATPAGGGTLSASKTITYPSSDNPRAGTGQVDVGYYSIAAGKDIDVRIDNVLIDTRP